MIRETSVGLGLIGLAGLLSGCEGGLAVNYYDEPRAVQVTAGHVCGPECDHYYDGARYVVVRGHHHHPGCGHILEGSHWILVGKAPASVRGAHVCGPSCHDHYWDGGKIVVIGGKHRHGPGCGHYFDGTHWVLAVSRGPDHAVVEVGKAPATRVHPAPERVVRIPAPPGDARYYVYDRSGSKWLKVKSGHVHGPKCGHVVVEGYWCLP